MNYKDENLVNPKHFLGIDLLRFLAASFVLLLHYCFLLGLRSTGLTTIASGGDYIFPELHRFTNFGWVGVQIFFVISGFVIAFSAEKATPYKFFLSRLVRLGPGVWICATISLVVLFGIGMVGHNELIAYVRSVLFIPVGPWIDGVYWTLRIEIAFYSLVFILLCFARFDWIKYLAVIIGMMSSVFWVIVHITGYDTTLEAEHSFFGVKLSALFDIALVHHGIYFAIGVFLWLQLTKKSTFSITIFGLLFSLAAYLQIDEFNRSVNVLYNVNYSQWIPYLIWLLSIVLIIASVKLNQIIHTAPQWFLRAIRVAGLMTYPLYLLHQMVGSAIMGMFHKFGTNRWAALIAATVIVYSVTLLIATQIEPFVQRATKSLVEFTRKKLTS